MKKTRIIIIVIIVVIGIFFFSNWSFAKYAETVLGKATCEIKYPIFIVENSDEIQGRISSINNNYYETDFNVLNYISNDNETKISEIDFEYTIKILPSTLDFPVRYRLINLKTNEEIALNPNLESLPINLREEMENHNYKLIVEWDKDNTNQNLDEKLDVKIQVIGVQKI